MKTAFPRAYLSGTFFFSREREKTKIVSEGGEPPAMSDVPGKFASFGDAKRF